MIKFFKSFFYFISLALLIVILLRLNHFEQIFSLKAHLYYKKYYLICMGIFVFGFLSNFIRKSIFLNLSLVIISILLCLYSFETILYFNEVLKRGEDKRKERHSVSKRMRESPAGRRMTDAPAKAQGTVTGTAPPSQSSRAS